MLIRSDRRTLDARRSAWIRDRGVCACCGVDCRRLELFRRNARRLRAGRNAERWRAAWLNMVFRYDIPSHLANSQTTLWHADHLIPISGGGSDSPENIQTLCWRCHCDKCGDESRRRARMPRKRILR